MKLLKKILKSKENIESMSNEQKTPMVISCEQNYKNIAKEYLCNNGNFEKRSMSFAYNENNKFLSKNDKGLINSLISCLARNNKNICENIKNSESEEEIISKYKLHEFLNEQLELITTASHKSWEQSEFNKEDKSLSKILDAISKMQKNFEKETSDMIKTSRKALELCANELFKDEGEKNNKDTQKDI